MAQMPDLLQKMDAYWRAANYLSVGQMYLFDNPLLTRPLAQSDVKRMLLGHWGTTPGQNFIYVHLNRVITKYDLDCTAGIGIWAWASRDQHTDPDVVMACCGDEEGTITTPFDMTVLNDLDRFHLVMDVIDRVPKTGAPGVRLKQRLEGTLIEHRTYIDTHGQDMPEVRDWVWPG